MNVLRNKKAVVVGASSGVGWATTKALLLEGARVTAVGRSADRLSRLRGELGEGIETVQADACEPTFAERLLRDVRPDLLVLTAGVVPHLAPISQQTWESFSKVWNADMQAAFHFVKAALTLPLGRDAVVIIVSSGAAIAGSPLSGGYAGAKRMQWLLVDYAQALADAEGLGIRFLAVIPKQFIEGTAIGEVAAEAYGARKGLSAAEVMRRFDAPLDPPKVAAAILSGLRGDVPREVTAVAVTGKAVEHIAP